MNAKIIIFGSSDLFVFMIIRKLFIEFRTDLRFHTIMIEFHYYIDFGFAMVVQIFSVLNC